MDVVVVGGGVIGCAAALALARQEARVTLLERASIASGTSQAAAGMLAPLSEADHEGPLLRAGLEALGEFDPWLDEVEVLSGMRTDRVRCGTLLVSTTPEEEERLRARHAWQRTWDPAATFLDRASLVSVAPYLSDHVRCAIRYPREAQLNPERYTRALARAAQVAGAEIREATPALAICTRGGAVTGVSTPLGTCRADIVLLATGTDLSLLHSLGLRLPLQPIKGELVRLLSPTPLLGPIVFSSQGYVTPRADGSVLVGATQLPGRCDVAPEAGSVARLLAVAFRLVPALRRAAFAGAWAGVRPTFPDLLPAIGPWPELEGLWLALGHHRNGILLASWTAAKLAAALTRGAALPVSFAPTRLLLSQPHPG